MNHKNLMRIERLEQMIIWDEAHEAATDFALRLAVILNKDEQRVMALHCQMVKGTSELLKSTGDPEIDRIIVNVKSDVEAQDYYSKMCQLVVAWDISQLFKCLRD